MMKWSKVAVLTLIIHLFLSFWLQKVKREFVELSDDLELRGYRLIEQIDERIRQLINETMKTLDRQTDKQVNVLFEKASQVMPLQNPYGAKTCSPWFGCHRGFCWAGCAGAFPSITGPEWCYTTNSTGKIACRSDDQCHACWRCSSSCSI